MKIEMRWYTIDPEWEETPDEAVLNHVGDYQVLQVRQEEGSKGDEWWGEWENI